MRRKKMFLPIKPRLCLEAEIFFLTTRRLRNLFYLFIFIFCIGKTLKLVGGKMLITRAL